MKTEAPSGNCAVDGSSPRPSEKTMISTTAQTNSGIAVADNPPTVMNRSRNLPSWRAANTPPRIASGTTMMNASTASLAEFLIAGPITSPTGRRNACDSPKSPVRTPPIQSRYCVTSGRSVPSSSLSAATARASANGPRTRRPTSPGRTADMAKMTTLRMKSVTRPRATRLAM